MLRFTRKARKTTFCLPFCLQLLLSQQCADSYDDPYQILTLKVFNSLAKLLAA